jgi:cell wall-associated NlpC family hydrolase
MSVVTRGRLLPALVALVAVLGGIMSFALVSAPSSHASTASTASRVLQVAASKQGAPYRWGATGPSSFDCSGYTYWVFNRVGKHLPRTSQQQYRALRHLGHGQVRPGDLIFFHQHGTASHVGIYAGRGYIWHAPHPGARVRLERIWTNSWTGGKAV